MLSHYETDNNFSPGTFSPLTVAILLYSHKNKKIKIHNIHYSVYIFVAEVETQLVVILP